MAMVARDPNRHIRLMADYRCFPLWYSGGDRVGELAPEDVPLSPDTRQGLERWADWFDSTLNFDDPAASPLWSAADREAFDQEGFRLWRSVRTELGESWRVDYHVCNRWDLWTVDENGQERAVERRPTRAEVDEAIEQARRYQTNGDHRVGT